MTTLDRGVVMVGLLLLALAATAMSFATLDSPFSSLMGGVWIVFVEIVVYFIATMAMNPKATLGMGAGTAVIFAFIRFVCSWVGGFAHSILPTTGDGYEVVLLWVNPLSAFIQVTILVLAGPYMLAYLIPELVGLKDAQRIRGDAAAAEAQPPTALEASPTGGFIQVFSYEELGNITKKSHGLEGFIIYSLEGLVVWKDVPVKAESDVLVAKLMQHTAALGALMQESGLTRMRRVVLESRDHYVYLTTLNQHFGLLLMFNGRVAAEEVHGRIAILAKSAREFLQWKYPAMPMSAGLSQDRVPMELN